MPWFAYIRDTNGALVSIAQTAEAPPAGITRVQLTVDPTDPAWMYDAATRTFVARPAKVVVDRLDDLLTDTDFAAAWGALNATRKGQLRNALIKLLGSQRFRTQSENVGL